MTAADVQSRRDKALHDPLTSSGGMHQASRLRRGVAEFLRIPLFLTVVFCALGVTVALLDAAADADTPLRVSRGRRPPAARQPRPASPTRGLSSSSAPSPPAWSPSPRSPSRCS